MRYVCASALPSGRGGFAAGLVVQRGYVPTVFGQLHFRESKPVGHDGRHRLVLLHQATVSSAQFERALAPLAAAGIHVVALDLPGCGMSDALPGGADLAALAECVLGAARTLGWQAYAMLGHHSGAAIAATCASIAPAAIRCVILNGFPLFDAGERERFRGLRLGEVELCADGSHLRRTWDRRAASTPGWTDLAAMHRGVLDWLSRAGTNGRIAEAVLAEDLMERLQRIACPGLLFTNTGVDLYSVTQRARRARPDFEYVELPGGTHDIVDERPDVWSAVVSNFVLRSGNTHGDL